MTTEMGDSFIAFPFQHPTEIKTGTHPQGFPTVRLGSVNFYLKSPDLAKQLLTAAVEALRILQPDADPVADLVEELLKADPVPGLPAAHAFVRPGQVAPDRPARDRCVECGEPEAAHAAPDAAQPEDIPDATGCPECGAVGLPRHEDGTCINRRRCAERQAAKASTR